MSQTKLAIPLGESGSLVYLENDLEDFLNNPEKKIFELTKKKVSNIYFFESIIDLIPKFKVHFQNISFQQVENEISFFDNVLISNFEKNILVLFDKNLDEPISFLGKLLLANDPSLDFKVLTNYLAINFPNTNFQTELKEFSDKLDKTYYHIRKEDEKNLKLLKIDEATKPKEFFETEYNLNALDSEPSDESIFVTNPKIEFNLSSFKEISEDEFNIGSFTDESNALEINLSSELNFIDSIEEPKSEIEIETIPLEPKKEIDFNELVNEEIEREAEENSFLFGNSSLSIEDFKENKEESFNDLSNIIEDDFDEEFQFNSGMEELDTEQEKLLSNEKLDLSFPKSIDENEIKVQNLKPLKPEFDPTHTFISKRIQDVILKEVLTEEDTRLATAKTPAQSFKGIELED